MTCNCAKMKIRETGWCEDHYFGKMKQIGEDDDGWRGILVCPECSQTWLVEIYDKLQYLFAIKIDDPSNASETKLLAIHIDSFLEKHGGESDVDCQMAGCENRAVNDFAFCAECLIQKRGVYE